MKMLNNTLLTTFLIHMICYWGMVYKYDSQTGKEFKTAVIYSLKNQICGTLPMTYLFFQYYPINYTNFLSSILLLPVVVLISDIYFFCTHYPFHKIRFLWEYHKIHHHGKVHVAKSLDADILEHVVANLGSFGIPFVTLRYLGFIFNIYILYFWVGLSTLNTCVSHLGFRSFGDKGIHHSHHKYLKCNYGTGFYVMDRFLGTYVDS